MALLLVSVVGTILRPLGIIVPDTGTITIVSVPSPSNFAEGRGVYRHPLQFTVVGANAAGYIAGTVQTIGIAQISATATKYLVDVILVMRIGDMEVNTMQGIPVGGTAPVQFQEPWHIADPNQVKVLAE